ncbi:MAG: hypothetical protein NTW97_02180 [Candidatus Krumholzibacteria bacterium]|nr:hypothetical protein [Candidatus Krumholzibacteria bacterium]
MRLASFLISVAVAAAAYPAGPLGATGLYTDPTSFFPASDSTRALVVIRQSECDLGTRRASMLTADLLIHPRPRFEIRIGLQFPAVRDNAGIRYGVGDLMLHASARIVGDSTRASGLFARADARIPTGSMALRPFSDGSFEGEGGLEARFAARGLAVRAAGLYTLAVENRQTADFANDGHLTLAGSIGADLPAFGSIGVSAFFVRFDGGEERNMYALSLGRELSPQLLFELSGAAEIGSAGSRVFDSCVSASFAYRFPPRPPAPSADSTKP